MTVHWQRPILDEDLDEDSSPEVFDDMDLELTLMARRTGRLRTKPLPSRHRGDGLDVLTWKRNRKTRWRRMAFVCILPSDIHAH